VICILLTQQSFSDRVLGVSRNVHVPTNCVLVSTGNNTLITGDLTRRVLACRIDPQCERPFARSFDRDFLAYCDERRESLIVAALTILRAYVCAGRPNVGANVLGSFEAWNRGVRDALIWLGCADPVDSLSVNAGEDPESINLGGLLEAWHRVYKGRPVTAAKAARVADVVCSEEDRRALIEAMECVAMGRNGAIDSRRLGEHIRRRKGQIVDGRRFMSAGTYQGVALWRVELAG
jgi:hypothetical protein